MEKILKTNNQTPTNINQNLILNNRNHLKIDAIKEIIRSNDSELLLKMNNNEKITILGNNLNRRTQNKLCRFYSACILSNLNIHFYPNKEKLGELPDILYMIFLILLRV